MHFHVAPADWPAELNKILDVKTVYSAPVVRTIFNPMLSWRRLLAVGAKREWQNHSHSWPSRTLQSGGMLVFKTKQEYSVLAAGRWGLIVLKLEYESDDMRRVQQGTEALKTLFLEEADISME